MPRGPGKYDQACSMASVMTGGEAVVLIVASGIHGTGFSMQCIDERYVRGLPQVLRDVADEIERAQRQGVH